MKVIIAGSRVIDDYDIVATAMNLAYADGLTVVTEVVSGGARGVDTLGEAWAAAHGVPVRRFDADWNKFGYAAGPIRNAAMATYADALVAVWFGASSGTKSMIELAQQHKLKIFVFNADPVFKKGA